MTQREQRLLMVQQLRLIEAIRAAAVQDGPEALAEFEEYWINSPEWSRIWKELDEMARRDRKPIGPTMYPGELGYT